MRKGVGAWHEKSMICLSIHPDADLTAGQIAEHGRGYIYFNIGFFLKSLNGVGRILLE